MKLDQKAMRLLPDKDDAIYFDDDLAGFGLRFRRTADGRIRRTWIAQYRSNGRTRRMKIGSVEKVDADEARKAVKKILARVELGSDPQADKSAARAKAAHTLRSVLELFLEFQVRRLRPESYRITKLYLASPRYFGPLHSMSVSEIATADVATRLRIIVRDSGEVSAGRARSALSTLFTWCAGEGLLGADPRNPVASTNNPEHPKPRDRVLSDAELTTLWHALDDDEYGRIVRLLILTGCRRQEIGGVRWLEIDRDKGTLSLPAERTKNGHPQVLPLTAPALAIVHSAPQRAGRDHLFGERSKARFTAPVALSVERALAQERLVDQQSWTMPSTTGTEASSSIPHRCQTKIARLPNTPRPFLRTRPCSSLSYPTRSYRAEIALLLHFGRPSRLWGVFVRVPKLCPLYTARACFALPALLVS